MQKSFGGGGCVWVVGNLDKGIWEGKRRPQVAGTCVKGGSGELVRVAIGTPKKGKGSFHVVDSRMVKRLQKVKGWGKDERRKIHLAKKPRNMIFNRREPDEGRWGVSS